MEKSGVQQLIHQYRGYLMKAGATPEVLSEIQVEGLFDNNAAIRLGYLKETKKDFGLSQPDALTQNNINIEL
jgi:hypothetical protein